MWRRHHSNPKGRADGGKSCLRCTSHATVAPNRVAAKLGSDHNPGPMTSAKTSPVPETASILRWNRHETAGEREPSIRAVAVKTPWAQELRIAKAIHGAIQCRDCSGS